jgi:transposase
LITKGRKEIRTLATMTDELLQLGDWLSSLGCTHVAIESTGVYWKPVFNLLEGLLTVILANARHIKAVPGGKTDVRGCEWLADLLRHGLLQARFISPLETRELRELVRYRQTLVTEHTAVANRMQKLIESAKIKLGQVASDVLGLSGRLMLRALAEGEQDATKLAELALGGHGLVECLTKVVRTDQGLHRAVHFAPLGAFGLFASLGRPNDLFPQGRLFCYHAPTLS